MATETANGNNHVVAKYASDPFPSSKFLVFAVQYANLGYWGCFFHWFSFGGQVDGKCPPNEKNETIKTNMIGTPNMLGLAKRVGVRILLTSTSEVYGDPLEHPQEEYWGNVNPIGVRSCYDEGKRVAETLMFDYHRQHDIGEFTMMERAEIVKEVSSLFLALSNFTLVSLFILLS
ncbi:unnamed protein product, partial [Musa hybrid cultivar]